MATQLPLTLPHSTQYGRDEFIAGPSNEAALRVIEKWPDGSSPVAILSGPAGAGKTHLVHIWAERVGADILRIDDLVSGQAREMPTDLALALEDVQPESTPEAALFHLINSAKERTTALLLTSRSPIEKWRVGLPDLRSRLRMATPIKIGAPDDDLLRKVLVKLFADRQLMVEKPVIDYILLRMERSLAAAAGIVEALDRAALAAGRSITRPMAAGILSQDDRIGTFADRQ